MSVKFKNEDLIFDSESNFRSWLKKHGKQKYLYFDEMQMEELRQYFKDLDDDGSEAIGVDELEAPLIALGLVENRQQVEKILI